MRIKHIGIVPCTRKFDLGVTARHGANGGDEKEDQRSEKSKLLQPVLSTVRHFQPHRNGTAPSGVEIPPRNDAERKFRLFRSAGRRWRGHLASIREFLLGANWILVILYNDLAVIERR